MHTLIDQIADTQSALNEGRLSPADVTDLWRVLDFGQFKMAGIMYDANITIDGEYDEEQY